MPRNKRGRKRNKKKSTLSNKNNFVEEAGIGCYIVRFDETSSSIIGWEGDMHQDDFDCEVPDVAVDPNSKTLSVCNVERITKVAIVTVYEVDCLDSNKKPIRRGTTREDDGTMHSCTTWIVLVPPNTFSHLCYMSHVLGIRIESDVQEWSRHPNPDDFHPAPLGFPLQGSFLCTQGQGGHLTHFFSGNLHAIDFRCPPGTPLLAVADATVVESQDHHTLSGIAVSNLFRWNSILLQLLDGLFVEYVHIRSSLVQKGDRVKQGQVIGHSGSVGFSPEPHLHFAAYRSEAPSAPTVGVCFSTPDKRIFTPKAGIYYNHEGACNNT